MASQEQLKEHPNIKKVVSLESFIFMAGFAVMFGVLGTKMGAINMLNTMMQTAYQLLMDTVFYIMAIAVWQAHCQVCLQSSVSLRLSIRYFRH